jgi:peptidoglycan/xylan/chitin deacetylase (PgdA/CDA1 family)
MSDSVAVPVLMYHGVAPERPRWIWNHLATPVGVFDAQMRLLRDRGWNTITLAQLYAHMKENAPLPEKPVVLTFDDGYLDNWVYVYPALKRYGHRAVVWMTTDFIDPAKEPRPNEDDLRSGRVSEGELRCDGFLSFAEMRAMEAGGHVEIQSHTCTHTWFPSGPGIVDYHRPAGFEGYSPEPWLSWNAFPEKKHEYMSRNFERDVPYGAPIYENRRALSGKRYFPGDETAAALIGHVKRNGGPAFFERSGWRGELDAVSRENPGQAGRMETDAEYEDRVRGELVDSKRILEEGLGKKIDFLCWPGGGRNETTIRIAAETGYLATTTHYQDKSRRNRLGEPADRIARIGCCSPWVWKNRHVIKNTDAGFFIASLEDFAGARFSIWKMRLYKLKYLVRLRLAGKY